MATAAQKAAARENLKRARAARSAHAQGKQAGTAGPRLSTAEKDRLPDSAFAFPRERKEPLIDARHVRNAVARFDQVEGVSDAERDRAWRRIRRAVAELDVEVGEPTWRALAEGGKDRR